MSSEYAMSVANEPSAADHRPVGSIMQACVIGSYSTPFQVAETEGQPHGLSPFPAVIKDSRRYLT